MLDELIVMYMIFKSTSSAAATGMTTTGSYALHFFSIAVMGYLWSQDAMGQAYGYRIPDEMPSVLSEEVEDESAL